MSKTPYNLFLDDLRSPQDAYDQEKHEMFLHKEWVVVRNYDEFVSYIHNNGLPQLIAFDHDLHEEHYTPKEFWNNYQDSMAYQDARVCQHKTGLDCAKFLIDYCEEYSKPLPDWYSHSANPIGRDRIHDIMFYYKRYSNQSFNTEKKVILKKALTYGGQFVDVTLLPKGIYMTKKPCLYEYTETIESIINSIMSPSDSFKNNIRDCQLTEIELSWKI